MPEKVTFQLSYDGEALRDGSMEIQELAPALLALRDLIDAASAHVTKGQASITLRVRSDFQIGSFDINLVLQQAPIKELVNFFSSDDASTLNNILGVLGFASGMTIGLVQLIKKLKGKKPQTVTALENGKVRLIYEGEGSFEVDEIVYKLLEDRRARIAVSGLVQPVRGKGIEVARVTYNTHSPRKCYKGEHGVRPCLGLYDTFSQVVVGARHASPLRP